MIALQARKGREPHREFLLFFSYLHQDMNRCWLNNVCVSRELNNVCVSRGLKAQQFLSPGPLGDEGDACLSKNALGGECNVTTP
jgi:hypothetical protein